MLMNRNIIYSKEKIHKYLIFHFSHYSCNFFYNFFGPRSLKLFSSVTSKSFKIVTKPDLIM